MGILVIIGIGAIAWYHYGPPSQPPPAPAPVAQTAPPPAPAAKTEPQYPVPAPSDDDTQKAPSLPALNDSDSAVRGELQSLAGKAPIDSLLIPHQIIARWVAFIDSLDRDGLEPAQWPVRALKSQPEVSKDPDSGTLLLNPDNAKRYAPYLAVVRAVDAKLLVAFYFRYYPLFQRAYENLGYGGHYFNTRLVHILDHLLATPVVDGAISLVQPSVRYKFADPELEDLSFGQKMLIRLGPDGEKTVKAKLREIRAAVIAGSKQPSKTGSPQ
ncbi:DUF3014 domain-containing protein [Solimonas marina]|uniref:DUF3014 domain-containing protein n=1 Tax=Solimonas marina TaxID=2714601 RepID=A0A969W896_9GAMM|nr:DUF3014 domain-containing protein [Solimonas marina]